MTTARGRFVGLATALAAAGVLLVVPTAERQPPGSRPTPAATAWASARTAIVPARLPDGTTYEPRIFLDAGTSVGTAPSPDGAFVRLLLRHADASTRQLRRLPLAQHPSFQPFTVDGDVLAWAENTGRDDLRLWTANLRDGRPARQLTADTGSAVFYDSQYDLLIADGRLHWAASGPGDATEIRSVALAGGAVDTRTEPGRWALSAWPWLVNGVTASVGTTLMRNMADHRDVTVPTTRRAATDCSPTWCRVVVLTDDGFTRIELMRPDGSAREDIAGSAAATVISDVAPLDRFEVLSQTGPYSEMTGNAQLLVFEIATHRMVEVSPDAGSVSYRSGMLWWATGDLETSIWHAVDLRTV